MDISSKQQQEASDKTQPHLIQATNMSRSFPDGDNLLPVLVDINLTVYPNDNLAIYGKSGCGKSTLLHIFGLLDRPSSGNLTIFGQDVSKLSESARALTRSRQIGFVFQNYPLLADFSAWENIAITLQIAGIDRKKQVIFEYLDRVGLGERKNHKPARLSGGEQQRLAIVRALIHQPLLLLCDEPTGSLDQDTSQEIFQLLCDQAREHRAALIIVTHDPQYAKILQRTVYLDHGKLSE